MSKPNYRATLTFDPDRKLFLARAPELEHCSGEGATRAEAVAKLEEEIDAQLANMLSHGSTPPRSVDEETFSGEVSAKVSKQLHRDLAYQARTEGVELDHLVGELLAAAMESRKQTRGARSGNSRPREDHAQHDNVGNRFDGGGARPQRGGFGGRGNNAHLLDDRANFIEYVRGLEQQGGAPRHGGPGGGHGGRPSDGGGRRRGGGGGGGGGRSGGGGGGRGPNPNFQRGQQGGGGPRPQQHAGGNGNFGGGNGNASPGAGSSGELRSSAPVESAPASHDPESGGNV
jgi:predicted HicB family RNase H-like nuclease